MGCIPIIHDGRSGGQSDWNRQAIEKKTDAIRTTKTEGDRIMLSSQAYNVLAVCALGICNKRSKSKRTASELTRMRRRIQKEIQIGEKRPKTHPNNKQTHAAHSYESQCVTQTTMLLGCLYAWQSHDETESKQIEEWKGERDEATASTNSGTLPKIRQIHWWCWTRSRPAQLPRDQMWVHFSFFFSFSVYRELLIYGST